MKKSTKNKGKPSKGTEKFAGAIAASNGTAPGHKLVERKRYTKELAVTAKPEEVAANGHRTRRLGDRARGPRIRETRA